MPLFTIIFFFFYALIIYFSLGYTVLSLTPLQEEEKFVSSFGVSSLIFSTSSLLHTVFKIPTYYFLPFLFLSIILASLLIWKKIPALLSPLTLIVTFFLTYLSFQAFLPLYSLGNWFGDWGMHYQLSQYYGGLQQVNWATLKIFNVYSVASRTPLFNLDIAFHLSLFGRKEFYIFQIFSTFLNTWFILPLYLLFKEKIKYKYVFGLLLFMPFIWRNATYTWNKFYTAYFVLLTLYFFLHRKESFTYQIMGGIFSGLSIYAHQYALFYLLPLWGYIALESSPYKEKIKALGIWLSIPLIILLPWYAWVVSLLGLKKTIFSSPVFWYPHLSLPKWLFIRGYNLISTLLPLLFFRYFTLHFKRGVPFVFLYSGLSAFYWGTVLGAYTLTFSSLLKKVIRNLILKSPPVIWVFLLAGIGGSIFFSPYAAINGNAQLGMAPSLFILAGVGLLCWSELNRKKRRLILTFLSLEFLLLIVLHPLFLSKIESHIIDANLQMKEFLRYVFIYDMLGKIRYFFLPLLLSIYGYVFLKNFK
ncbi:MAG: hypothetical protein GXO71_03555 [Caldiserica bacterium]|nr:hypothetical protein [Caldisericota bacterium]